MGVTAWDSIQFHRTSRCQTTGQGCMIRVTRQVEEVAARIRNQLASRIGQEEEPKLKTRASASKRAIQRNDRTLAADQRTQKFAKKLRRLKKAARMLRVNSKRTIERRRRLALCKSQSLKVPM